MHDEIARAMDQALQAAANVSVLSSLLWITVTAAAYGITMTLYRRSRAHPLMLPVLTGTALVVLVLQASGTSYADYLNAVQPLILLVGPATVALAIPLFGQIRRIKAIWLPITLALSVGSAVAILSALLIAWTFGADAQLLISLAPKSSTMPIAISLSTHFGGIVPLAAAAVAVTGIAGAMLSGPLLKWAMGPVDDAVQGFALGLSAHAIGTARALQINETAGAFAAMGMSLNGLLTALWMPLIALWLRAY